MGPNFFEKYQVPNIKGLPKYAQLREVLFAAIKDGYWGPGSKLPPEGKLIRSTPFSLGTVQRALRSLVEEGAIVRRQGLGTFVVEDQKRMDMPWHCRFTSDKEGEYLPVYPKIVLRKKEAGSGLWDGVLGANRGKIIQIDRIMNIGNEFSVYSRFFISRKKFAGLLKKTNRELERTNFKTILRREYNQVISHMNYNLRFISFPSEICRAIKVREGVVGMLMEIVASSGRQRPIYYQELYIPPNKRKLHISDSSNIPEYWI